MSHENDPSDSDSSVETRPASSRLPTVLESISVLTGGQPKILLRDSDSEHGTIPVLDPKSRERNLLPKGRGNYQVLGEIARGGMGVVLKGHDTDLGRDVALKVLDPELAANPTVVQRFVEEAQIGGQLQHPGVVPVYELGQMADERPYFTMKLIKGRTLAALLSRRKTLDEDRRRFLSIFEQICQTVAYAHSKGVVHRDLKPANIMVGAFGEVQVVDWGLAKVIGQGGVDDELRARQTNLTIIETVRSGPGSVGSDSVAGSVMGTPAYMAPEQAMGEVEKVDERADVFSLGAVLCEILTDQPPYVAAEGERTIVLAANARLDPARERLSASPADEDLKNLCTECLSPARQARPRNAEEVADRIHDYLSRLEERAHQAELAAAEARVKADENRRRQRLTLALAATIVISLIAFGAGYAWVERQREARAEGLIRAVDDAQAQVLELQSLGRFDQAVEVARSTVVLIESSDVADPGLRERTERAVGLAQMRAAEDALRLEREARRRALLERCEEIGLERINLTWAPTEAALDREYVAAFRDFGVDLETQELPDALALLRQSGAGEEIALALDDWAGVRRRLFGWEAYEVEALMSLAFDLDPDPTRTRLREALLIRDQETLLELAEREESVDLPASTLWVLYRAIAGPQSSDQAHRLLRRAADRQPASFLLNAAAGSACWDRNEFRAGLSYLAGARAIRPGNYLVHALLGDTLNRIGDVPAAVAAYAESLRLNPEFVNVLPPLVSFTNDLGRFDESAAYAGMQVARNPTAREYELFGLRARSMAGELPSSELVSWLEAERSPAAEEVMSVAWALVVHPDPAQRDPAKALALARQMEVRAPVGSQEIQALAHLWLGRPGEALVALERADAIRRNPVSVSIYRLGMIPALWSWALHGTGRTEEARAALEQARAGYDFVFQGRPEQWQDAAAVLIRDEVEAILDS